MTIKGRENCLVGVILLGTSALVNFCVMVDHPKFDQLVGYCALGAAADEAAERSEKEEVKVAAVLDD